MRFAKKIAFVLMFVPAAVLGNAAQEVAHFTLQYPTILNGNVVRAGAYQLQMVAGPTTIALISAVDGNGDSLLVVPVARDYEARCAKSTWQVFWQNSQRVAQSFCLAAAGLGSDCNDPRRPAVAAAAFARSR